MTIGEIDLDCESLTRWLQNKETGEFQRDIEEKIMQFLFNNRTSDAWFLKTIEMLAWIGTHPNQRALLEREIVDLNCSDSMEAILKELIILKPHPEAEGIDHAFQSPTYQDELKNIL